MRNAKAAVLWIVFVLTIVALYAVILDRLQRSDDVVDVDQKNDASSPSVRGGGRTANNHNKCRIPPWSDLPRTRYTDHVLGILQDLRIDEVHECSLVYNFTISSALDVPNITFAQDGSLVGEIWYNNLRQIFEWRGIPYNISLGLTMDDGMDLDPLSGGSACLGNSAPEGRFSVPNMEDLGEMIERRASRGTKDYGYRITNDKPWEERKTTPIFRGTAWIPEWSMHDTCNDANATYDDLLREFPGRFKAVHFSLDHPDMLDARFTGVDRSMSCTGWNSTNGLNRLFVFDFIDPNQYFQEYQVTLVLSGIGAAFRLSRHFQGGQAVVLQESQYKEWYTPYLDPFVHYVPLAENMSDLEEKLIWVKNHPETMKRIGENGRAFYEEYLTFEGHEEHIYELVYRLSEYSHFKSNHGPTRELLRKDDAMFPNPS